MYTAKRAAQITKGLRVWPNAMTGRTIILASHVHLTVTRHTEGYDVCLHDPERDYVYTECWALTLGNAIRQARLMLQGR